MYILHIYFPNKQPINTDFFAFLLTNNGLKAIILEDYTAKKPDLFAKRSGKIILLGKALSDAISNFPTGN